MIFNMNIDDVVKSLAAYIQTGKEPNWGNMPVFFRSNKMALIHDINVTYQFAAEFDGEEELYREFMSLSGMVPILRRALLCATYKSFMADSNGSVNVFTSYFQLTVRAEIMDRCRNVIGTGGEERDPVKYEERLSIISSLHLFREFAELGEQFIMASHAEDHNVIISNFRQAEAEKADASVKEMFSSGVLMGEFIADPAELDDVDAYANNGDNSVSGELSNKMLEDMDTPRDPDVRRIVEEEASQLERHLDNSATGKRTKIQNARRTAAIVANAQKSSREDSKPISPKGNELTKGAVRRQQRLKKKAQEPKVEGGIIYRF